MDLETAAGRLYGLTPDQFVAERTALAAQAKETGDTAAAAAIRRLAKPSQPAWQVNLLVREHPDSLERLAEIGRALRAAAESGDPAAVRAANAARQKGVSSLADQAASLAEAAGRPTTVAVRREVEATLQAALSSPTAAESVSSGRLTTSLFDSGLDALGLLSLAPAPPPTDRAPARATPEDHAGAGEDPKARALAAARAALEAAQGALREAKGEAARTRSEADQLDEEVAQLATRLEALRRRATAASDRARAAETRARAAGEAQALARKAFDSLDSGRRSP